MNMAEKYLQENMKTVEINGIEFLIRKFNSKDVFEMGQHLAKIRKMAEIRTKAEKLKDKKDEDCDDCPEEPLKFTIEEIQKLGELDLRVALLNCVMRPKIVEKEFGKQKNDEIPYEILDSNTANKLFKEIENFSVEVFEGVSFDSFPEEQDGNESDEDVTVLKPTPKSVSGLLSPEDESSLEDEIGRIVQPGEGDADEGKGKVVSRSPRKDRKRKKRDKE
jgi:hypothetical protein